MVPAIVQTVGVIWRVGLVHALVIGIVLGILMQFGEQFFLLVGQGAELSQGAGRVLAMNGLGLAGLLCIITTSLFLEGLQRPVPAMVVVVGSNFLNIYLNWVLIFGNHGAPAMGAEGAALATSIVRWVAFFALLAYVFYAVDRVKYGILIKISQFREFSKNLRQLGYPTAIAHGMESASFLVVTLFAGYMGVLQTAAWTIGMNLITLAFMVALGFAMAASVRVANYLGQNDPHTAAASGWTALTLSLVCLGLIMALFLVCSGISGTDLHTGPGRAQDRNSNSRCFGDHTDGRRPASSRCWCAQGLSGYVVYHAHTGYFVLGRHDSACLGFRNPHERRATGVDVVGRGCLHRRGDAAGHAIPHAHRKINSCA